MTDKTYTADERGMAFVEGLGWVVECPRAVEYAATLRQPSSQAGAVDAGALQAVVRDMRDESFRHGPETRERGRLQGFAIRIEAALARPASSEPASGEAEPVAWLHKRDPSRCTSVKALAESNPSQYMPVYTHPAEPVKVADGWRVMACTSSVPRPGDRWEIYDPSGSGGVVTSSEVADPVVRRLLDSLANTPKESTP
jgi:hypothetical protein